MAKLVTICGSMRFADTMMQAARVLETKQGCIALQCVYLAPGDALTQDEIATFGQRRGLHRRDHAA